MKRFLHMSLATKELDDKFLWKINDYGFEGWELVTVVYDRSIDGYIAVLKREAIEEED